jgi:hypothetical protein
MKKIVCLVFISLSFSLKTTAQTNASINPVLLQKQWYEWPKEEPNATTLVFHLTEYTVIVGKDYFAFDPSKLNIAGNNQYKAESLKTKNSDPQTSEKGTWQLTNDKLIFTSDNKSKTYKIQSVDSNKLVLIIE